MWNIECVKVSLRSALVLGTVYFMLNHSVALFTGNFTKARIIPAVLQYVIPYLVCSYGYINNEGK